MKYASAFRDPSLARGLLAAIADQADKIGATKAKPVPVSYTHLDVYKRQGMRC